MADTMEIIYNDSKPYNKKHWRTFEASSDLFSGFRVDINITKIDTLDDIVIKFVDKLKRVLELNNFIVLLEELNRKQYHIHNYTLENILTSDNEDIFYVCDHC
uniref:Uncharacterized protein n=1 Tax=viral metagenome TaxID=1070528 RepID=A0A6C0C7H8_9ZZZZ